MDAEPFRVTESGFRFPVACGPIRVGRKWMRLVDILRERKSLGKTLDWELWLTLDLTVGALDSEFKGKIVWEMDKAGRVSVTILQF